MKLAIRPLLVVLLLALVSVGSPQTVERPLGGTWVNLIGEEPTLERLEGRAVLLHYFGPRRDENGNVSKDGGLKGAYIPLLRKFHHEHDRRGLVVLGFYDGPRSELEDFFKKYDIPYPVAIGGRAREEFSVDGPNHLVFLDREGAVGDTIHDLWPTAATYQRELKEMFGIDFPGSQRVDEEFILEGWTDMPPYRRDFDTLAYSQQTYAERGGRETHDPRTHMARKLTPEGR